MRVIQFTHTDLDGVACAIVAKQYYGRSLKTYFCNYQEVDETVRTVLGELEEAGRRCTIIISDLAYSEECTDITIKLLSQHEVIIADHHKSHLWMNKVFQPKHKCIVDEGKYCGAYILKSILSKMFKGNVSMTPGKDRRLTTFVNYVNDWDTWAWASNVDYRESAEKNIPLLLANAQGMLDDKVFMADINEYIESSFRKHILAEHHLAKTLEYQERQIDVVNEVLSKRQYKYVETNEYGLLKLLFLQDTEHFQSIISEYALPYMDDETSFVMVVEPECASLRKGKPGIDLSLIAKQFGGGGHSFAAGGVDYEGHKDEFMDVTSRSARVIFK